MKIRLYWQATETDSKGKVVRKTRKMLGHSYLPQFFQMISGLTQASYNGAWPDTGTWKNTAGNASSFHANNSPLNEVFASQAPAGSNTYGIVVGTGSAANTTSTSQLTTIIAPGTGAGQLQHGSMAYVDTAIVGSVVNNVLSRTFTNGSGASITISEIGLILAYINSVPAQDEALVIRDVLVTPYVLANGNNVTWTLTLSYVVA